MVTLDIVDAQAASVSIDVDHNPNCAGLLTAFSIKNSSGGGTPVYTWYVNSKASGAAGTGNTFSSSSLVDGDQVWVEMQSTLACVTGPNPVESAKIPMEIKAIPDPVIQEADQTICSPKTFTFHATVDAGPGITYQWMRDGKAIAGATNASYTATQSGVYTINEDNGTCNQTSGESKLTIIQTPIAYAGEDMYIQEGTRGQLFGAGGALYTWSPATGLSDANVYNPTFTAENTIAYMLTVADASNTCKSEDAVIVYVEKPIKVPNVITVNGDGTNDTWEIENIESYPNAEFLIYNRWGNLVWKSSGYPKKWDGTNFRNGEVLPDGTYFYIITLNSKIYNEPYTGWIQIVK